MNDNAKTYSIISYVTLLGWLIAVILNSQEPQKNYLSAYHLRQGLGLHLTFIVLWIVLSIFGILPFIGWLIAVLVMPLVSIGYIVFIVLGAVNANTGDTKPLPLVGQQYQRIFSSLFE